MRTLGFALLALSVLLGTGGVALRSAAEGSSTAAAAEPADAGHCPVPDATRKRTTLRTAPVQAAPAREVIILNTRGYNYRRPGDSPVTPVEVIPPAAPEARPSPEEAPAE